MFYICFSVPNRSTYSQYSVLILHISICPFKRTKRNKFFTETEHHSYKYSIPLYNGIMTFGQDVSQWNSTESVGLCYGSIWVGEAMSLAKSSPGELVGEGGKPTHLWVIFFKKTCFTEISGSSYKYLTPQILIFYTDSSLRALLRYL